MNDYLKQNNLRLLCYNTIAFLILAGVYYVLFSI